MDSNQFKEMWERMQGDGYFANSIQYDDYEDPLRPRQPSDTDLALMQLDYSADHLHFPVPHSRELEASVLHTERHWLPMMFDLPAQGLALDLGCGYGRSVVWLKERFDAVIGLDISQTVLETARRTFANVSNVSFAFAPGEQFPETIGPDSVDFIYAFTVFQHIPREFTANYLRDARRRLREGGLIVFNLISDLNEDVNGGVFGTEWLIGYSDNAARRLVEDAGLRLERIVRWTADGAPGSWLWVGARR